MNADDPVGMVSERLAKRASEYGADPRSWLNKAIDSYLSDRPAVLAEPPLGGASLFVYGSLKPGELAYPQVEPFVASAVDDVELPHYRLRSRDGLPLLVEEGDGVVGSLLSFRNSASAYTVVRRFEPSKHYRWVPGGVEVALQAGRVPANALKGTGALSLGQASRYSELPLLTE